jgi:ribosomal protein L11 methylase PrmA
VGENRELLSHQSNSFRDKRSFVIEFDNKIYRALDDHAFNDLNDFINTELYLELKKENKMVSTRVIRNLPQRFDENYKNFVEHSKINFISYVHNWTFNMLKDAAILTLEIQKRLIEKDYSLKDATPYNIQFLKSKPIFIDMGSIEKYNGEAIWYGYKQFCEMFLYPLILCDSLKINLQDIYPITSRGISAKSTWKMIKSSQKLRLRNIIHIKSQIKSPTKTAKAFEIEEELKKAGFTKQLKLKQIEALKRIIVNLDKNSQDSKWSGYSTRDHYGEVDLKQKEEMLVDVFNDKKYTFVVDWGCNDGLFSKKVVELSPETFCVALDSDAEVVDKLFLNLRDNNVNIQPLVVDICNPTPAFGWENTERQSFLNTIKPDLHVVYALIHHLFITENIPWKNILQLFSKQGDLIIEFPHIDDPKVQQLISQKKDIDLYVSGYDKAVFEKELSKQFRIKNIKELNTRTIYFCENINDKL